jgi:hypothetical protein
MRAERMGADRRVPVLTDTSRTPDPDRSARRLTFGEVSIDVESRRVRAPGGTSRLEPRAFDLLLTLAERPGLTVSRDHLLETVWGENDGSGAALNLTVNQLRQALGDDDLAPRFIETVPWIGYRWIYERPPERTRWSLGPVLEAAGAMLAIAVGGAGGVGANAWTQGGERPKRVAGEPRSFVDR